METMEFNTLKKAYQDCSRCPELCKSRTQVVFGSGNKNADVVFIGEAPGASEDAQGIPFCGMSGKVLDELLSSIALKREDIFITNTILCRPENNRNPTKKEVENCHERLDELLAIMQPKVIVTIGNFATQRIIGRAGITAIRGKVFEYASSQGNIIKVVPVIHPASYLYSGRNPQKLEQMKDDFATIKRIIEESAESTGKKEQKQKNLMEF